MTVTRRDFCKKGLAAGLAAGALLSPLGGEAFARSRKRSKGRIAKRVIIITFDGIRVDGLAQARTPNIDMLVRTGSASMATRDVMPSVTLPNYTSHLYGAGPEVHGVTANDWKKDNFKLAAVETDEEGYFPSVFKVLKQNVKGIRTAFYWNWKPLVNPHNPRWFDDSMYAEKDAFVPLYDRAMEYIGEHRDEPLFMFIYSVHTDHAGHKYQWMSPEYIRSIEEGDVQVGRLTDFLKEEGIYDDTHLMFISDHGGIGNGHGGISPEEMIVPWIIEGPGIKEGFTIDEPNNTVNTASTVLRLFGVEQPLSWTGEVPESIFR